MIKGWPEKIEAAQSQPLVMIDGTKHYRIRYGEETKDFGADRQPCRDRGVEKGQLHVVGCELERCAVCGARPFPAIVIMEMIRKKALSNLCVGGKGGIASLFHTSHARSAPPQHHRCAVEGSVRIHHHG